MGVEWPAANLIRHVHGIMQHGLNRISLAHTEAHTRRDLYEHCLGHLVEIRPDVVHAIDVPNSTLNRENHYSK